MFAGISGHLHVLLWKRVGGPPPVRWHGAFSAVGEHGHWEWRPAIARQRAIHQVDPLQGLVELESHAAVLCRPSHPRSGEVSRQAEALGNNFCSAIYVES